MPPDDAIVDAAVLIPLLRLPSGPRLVMVERAPGGVYGGQIAFPGGKQEPGDTSLLDTAIRETAEETGLDADTVVVLEHLEPVTARTTSFRVAPFLAEVQRPARWVPEPGEVASVLEVPVARLTAPGARLEAVMDFPTWPEPRLTPYYQLSGHRLWGLTLRILDTVLPRLAAGEWD